MKQTQRNKKKSTETKNRHKTLRNDQKETTHNDTGVYTTQQGTERRKITKDKRYQKGT